MRNLNETYESNNPQTRTHSKKTEQNYLRNHSQKQGQERESMWYRGLLNLIENGQADIKTDGVKNYKLNTEWFRKQYYKVVVFKVSVATS